MALTRIVKFKIVAIRSFEVTANSWEDYKAQVEELRKQCIREGIDSPEIIYPKGWERAD